MEERRLHRRFPFEQAIELRGNGDQRYQATTSDLSEVGLGMLVSRDAVNGLAQSDHMLSTGDPLCVVLSTGSVVASVEPLKIQCRVKQVRRLSYDRFVLSAWFDDASAQVRAVVSQLLSKASQNAIG